MPAGREMLAVPFTVLRGSFYHFAAAYTALLTLSGALSLVLFLRGRGRKPARRQEKKAFSYWEKLYLLAFLVLAAFTVFRAFTWDTTVMNYDDSEYLTRAADALEHGMLLGVSVTKGMAEEIYLKRATQGFLFFPAWLSWLSGLPVTVSARTVLESTHLLLAYSVYAAMAFTICRKREDGLIFLLLLMYLSMGAMLGLPQPPFLATCASPGIYILVAMLPPLKHLANHTGWMLKVGIHDDGTLPTSMIEACQHGRLLAKVARQLHVGHPLVGSGQPLQHLLRVVRTAIIDEQQLKPYLRMAVHQLAQFVIQCLYRLLFIVGWNDDSYQFHLLLTPLYD